jgi:hypothetical protein
MPVMSETMIISAGPWRAGGRYLSGYWQQEYEVLSFGPGICGSDWSVTVRWADGRTTRHCTPWDARRDRVISLP